MSDKSRFDGILDELPADQASEKPPAAPEAERVVESEEVLAALPEPSKERPASAFTTEGFPAPEKDEKIFSLYTTCFFRKGTGGLLDASGIMIGGLIPGSSQLATEDDTNLTRPGHVGLPQDWRMRVFRVAAILNPSTPKLLEWAAEAQIRFAKIPSRYDEGGWGWQERQKAEQAKLREGVSCTLIECVSTIVRTYTTLSPSVPFKVTIGVAKRAPADVFVRVMLDGYLLRSDL